VNEEALAIIAIATTGFFGVLYVLWGRYHQEQDARRRRDRAEIRHLRRQLDEQQRKMRG
jgi:hypothetical protein